MAPEKASVQCRPTIADRTRVIVTGTRNHPPLAILLAVIAAAGLLVLLLGPIAWWAAPVAGLRGLARANVLNATRQTLLAAVGGLAVLTGLGFTARTYYLTRRGQLTERYSKAISQLASDKLTERLGGIYALEHLMVESERDHDTVIEVLAAFIRENATTVHPAWVEEPLPVPDVTPPRPTTDVQAALTVLCRRPERTERSRISLRRTDLRGADLTDGRLGRADLFGAALQRAFLNRADLADARLTGAHLQEARLSLADLRDADITDAQLQRATLYGARMQHAYLYGSDLSGASLSSAHLEGAHLCDADQGRPATVEGAALASAYVDNETHMTEQQRDTMNAVRLQPR